MTKPIDHFILPLLLAVFPALLAPAQAGTTLFSPRRPDATSQLVQTTLRLIWVRMLCMRDVLEENPDCC